MFTFYGFLSGLMRKFAVLRVTHKIIAVVCIAIVLIAAGVIVYATIEIKKRKRAPIGTTNRIRTEHEETIRRRDRLVLLKEKEDVLKELIRFINDWTFLSNEILSAEANDQKILVCQSVLFHRKEFKIDYETSNDMGSEYALRYKNEVVAFDIDIFKNLKRLFLLNEEHRAYIARIVIAYNMFMESISVTLQNGETDMALDFDAQRFATELEKKKAYDSLISDLKNQRITTKYA